MDFSHEVDCGVCGDGACGEGESSETCPDDCSICRDSFSVAGSTEEIGSCYADGSGYFVFFWGCLATNITYFDENGEGSALEIGDYGFNNSFFWFGFEWGQCLTFELTFEDGPIVTASACTDCSGDGGP